MSDLAEKIRKRRQQAGIEAGINNPDSDSKASFPIGERIARVKEAIKRNDYDPILLAGELSSLIHKDSFNQTELAKEIGVSQGWISKLLSLDTAPVEARDRIRKGELSITDYHRSNAERAKNITITRKQAIDFARFIRDVAVKHGLNVELSRKPTKTELFAIFDQVQEIRDAVLKS